MSTRRGFLGALFSALLAFVLLDPGAAIAQEVKQIKLTEKNIQGFAAASKDMAKLYDGADPSADNFEGVSIGPSEDGAGITSA